MDDPNGNVADLFVRDREAGITECITCPSLPVTNPGNWTALNALSADGRYVVIYSGAQWPDTGITESTLEIYLWDRVMGGIKWIGSPVAPSAIGTHKNAAVSLDGRFVAFDSFVAANNARVSIVDRLSGFVELIPLPTTDGGSALTSISGNGRFVVFKSWPANSDSSQVQAYVYDRLTGEIRLVSSDASGIYSNARIVGANISADGRYIAFDSNATNLVSGDTNGKSDIFVAPNPLYDCEAQ